VRAVVLRVDETLLADRARRGLDRRDEMWEGVLHMVPPASFAHGELQARIAAALLEVIGTDAELVVATEAGLFLADDDYRVPDLLVCARSSTTERGAEAPLGRLSLVVEILSPDDETFDKLGFYNRCGVGQILVVDPAAGFTLYEDADQMGAYRVVEPPSVGDPVRLLVGGGSLLVPTDGSLELRTESGR
jgi:Uma2 family endonuclease